MLMQLNEYWIESKWLTKALLKKQLIGQLGDQVQNLSSPNILYWTFFPIQSLN